MIPPIKFLLQSVRGEAVDLALRAVVNPGDEVLVPEPTYVSYAPSAVLAGGVAVPVPTYEKDDFRLTADVILSHYPKTKAIVSAIPITLPVL